MEIACKQIDPLQLEEMDLDEPKRWLDTTLDLTRIEAYYRRSPDPHEAEYHETDVILYSGVVLAINIDHDDLRTLRSYMFYGTPTTPIHTPN